MLLMSTQLVKVVRGGFPFISFNVNFYGSLLSFYLFQGDFQHCQTSKILKAEPMEADLKALV